MDDITGRGGSPKVGQSADADGDSSDPKAMLELLNAQQRRTAGETTIDDSLLYLAWGVAILVGYTASYLAGSHAWGLPPVLGAAVSIAGGLFAIAVTILHVARRTRGMSGPGNRQGAWWGIAWAILFFGLQLLGAGLARAGASDEILAVFYPGGAGLITGAMYLSGGALWNDSLMYSLGIWILVVFGAAAVVGLPIGFLVMALLGGGGLLVGAAVARRRNHRRTGLPA